MNITDPKDRSISGLSVLVLDDEPLLRRRIGAHLKALGAEVTEADTIQTGRERLTNQEFDFLLLDVNLPDGIGLDLLRDGVVPSGTGTVVMTAEGGVEGAVEAIQLGALDYLIKPFDPGLLPLVMGRVRQIRQAERLNEYERTVEEDEGFFFGQSLAPLKKQLEKIIAADKRLQCFLPPVLITGGTGSGKSAIARWLHRHGPRAEKPLIEVNCSALPESLAESELFGHERGAFTGAHAARQGLFEAAHGGTLFLDELPSLSAAIQAKILTAIEDRNIRRVGGTRPIEVDVRILAATNRDLNEAVQSGEFREDLQHRLDLFRLNLPPLHERGEDILHLAECLLRQLCRRHRLPLRKITKEGEHHLLSYRWPGNVRELAHELERGLIFEESATLSFAHLPGEEPPPPASDWLNPGYDFSKNEFVLEDAINRLIQLTLKQSGGNTSQAARMLGVTRDFIRYRLHGDRKETP